MSLGLWRNDVNNICYLFLALSHPQASPQTTFIKSLYTINFYLKPKWCCRAESVQPDTQTQLSWRVVAVVVDGTLRQSINIFHTAHMCSQAQELKLLNFAGSTDLTFTWHLGFT